MLINGPAGELELRLNEPKQSTINSLMIICHPHPLGGGSMDNKVVTTLSRACQDEGMLSICFNFRGVGASTGEFDNANGEVEDLMAVIVWSQQHYPGYQLSLAGFSFGAYVAYKTSLEYDCQYLISIAPAVHLYDFRQLALPSCPWYVIQGDEDELVPIAEILAWVDAVKPAAKLIEMPAAGHFFHGRLIELRQHIKQIIKENILEQRPD